MSLLAVSAVSAADNTTSDVVSVENNQVIEQTENEKTISTTDDGTFTALQNKINNAAEGSTITLENDYIYDESFDTNGIQIKYKHDLTIDGKGHTLNGLSKSRILMMSNVYNLTIKNIKFKNGYSVDNDEYHDQYGYTYTNGNGGAIFLSTSVNSKINLNLINCEFDNNIGKNGGAIFGEIGLTSYSDYSSPTCIINDCTFTNNTAKFNGGAISDSSYDDKNWFIVNCNFNSNQADSGGAISSEINNLQVIDCIFSGNVVASGGGAINIDQSYVQRNGKPYQWVGSVNTNVSNCEFNNNEGRIGGAIYWRGNSGNLDSSIFKYNVGNTAKDIYWDGENGVINNCKSITTGNKENNLYLTYSAEQTTSVNGFDIKFNSKTTLSFSQDKHVVTLTAKLTPTNATGTVRFNISNSYNFVNISNGKAELILKDLEAGDYSASAIYMGNSDFDLSASNEIIFNIAEVYPILTAKNLTKTYGNTNKLVVNLMDSKGKAIANVVVNLNINNKVTPIKTNANGQATMAFSQAPGTYYAKITYPGAKGITAKITVKKASPKITAKAKTFKRTLKTKKYSITLKNNKNKVMKNTKVTIKVNGKTYSAKTNSKGVATFKITKLTKKGSFKATVTYAGSKYYNKVTKTVTIKTV